jgi:hypothetical protein
VEASTPFSVAMAVISQRHRVPYSRFSLCAALVLEGHGRQSAYMRAGRASDERGSGERTPGTAASYRRSRYCWLGDASDGCGPTPQMHKSSRRTRERVWRASWQRAHRSAKEFVRARGKAGYQASGTRMA